MFVFLLVPIKVNALTITLDPGHGGYDSGAANSSKKIYEKDVNFKISQYLKKYLEEYENVKIITTRNSDKFVEVFDRAIIGRKNKSDLLISLHTNDSKDTKLSGAEVYVSSNESLDKYNKQTTALGNKILNNLNKIGIKNRGVKTRVITNDDTDIYSDGTIADYYGIIRYSMRGCKIDSGVISPDGSVPARIEKGEGMPAILIEHCFINSSDYNFVDSEEDLKKLAKADADAVASHYNLKKKSFNKFKIKEDLIIVEPDTTIKNIQEKYPTAKIVSSVQNITTGTKIDIDNIEYKVVKLGDCNGDGNITPADYVKIKNNIMRVSKLSNENKIAADVNEDKNITPADYVKVKNHIMKVSRIQMKLEE